MPKITKLEALQRTKDMLEREWNLPSEPLSDTNLRKAPPNGLGKNDNQIRALETPIETVDFADVDADVVGIDLIDAKIVSELRDVIWKGIPKANKSPSANAVLAAALAAPLAAVAAPPQPTARKPHHAATSRKPRTN